MNFDHSEEQELFRSSVERFAAPIDVEARRKLRLSPTGYDRERWTQLAELGLIALAASEEAGGMGGSNIDLALVAEAIGQANSPDPWLEHGVLPALLLERGGVEGALEKVTAGPLPQETLDEVPLGGHYRFEVLDGKIVDSRTFTNSCISLPTGADDEGNKPAGLTISHLLDPIPTEIHVFSTYAARVPIYVITSQNERIWVSEVSGGKSRVRLIER